jgi:hypothetical protein
MQPEQLVTKLMAVLVVYERDLAQVAPWPRLQSWLASSPEANSGAYLDYILIYDNSRVPRARPPDDLMRCRYVHNPANGGTAAAYEHAVALAGVQGAQWLLLLDHDTSLPADFLQGVALHGPSAAAAVVPWVTIPQRGIVSPMRVTRAGSFRALQPGKMPPAGEHLTAVASGSVLHVPTIKQLLPLPSGLWLDYVDHWIFTQLHRNGLTVAISNQRLQHEMAWASLKSLSAARLESMLAGERIFNRRLGRLARLVYPVRLLSRILRIAWANPPLAVHALKWMAAGGLRNG